MAKRAMGKGLSAILGEEIAKVNKITDAGAEKLVGQVAMISLNAITTNPFQPRSNFDNDALVELAQSITELGIIQPITVRKNGIKFELISGERRFRASQIAGLEEIPAYVRLADDRKMLELAIVENLQREDLDPIEMAYSFRRMMNEIGLTQEEVAKRLGKGRSTVTNFLRLLKLPAIIQAELRDINRNESLDENSDETTSVVFSMGHARALLNLPSEEIQIDLYKKILKGGLSVRQTEVLAAAMKKPKEKAPEAQAQTGMKELGKELGQYFQTKVNIQVKPNGKGRIQIDFDSDGDLQRIISKFNS